MAKRGRPKLSADALLKRGTFEQRRQGDRLEQKEFELVRPKLPPRPRTHYKPQIPIDYDDLIEANYEKNPEDCVAEIPRDLSEEYARKWIWDASDELAIRNGCRFDLKRAMHFAYTLRNYLTLWEGPWAGEPFVLRTWQPECLLRVFGWVRPHEQFDWVRRYSKSSIWIPKKSGKSPTGAGVAIYCWRFDGVWKEENQPHVGGGSHVFCIAKNGKQAKIVWRHASNMTEHSPLLSHEMETGVIRRTEILGRMNHQKNLSDLTIMTGDSKAALAASEGFNAACIICDEAHVVEEATVEVTRDAGVSQPQFLWFQISTYGTEDGYGKKDLQVGRDVAEGKIEDDAFFFKTYEAPQDISDEDCGKEEIWQASNPNFGYTVSKLQFKQAYERTKDDPQQFSGFKQRRLNIWQRSTNPMVNYDAWMKCGADIDHEMLKGCRGGAGLDLAGSEDWAAFAIAWDVGPLLHCWVKMWTTTSWIDQNSYRAQFEEWVSKGFLHVHDGEAINFEDVESEIYRLLKHARVKFMAYDSMFSMQMSQNLRIKLPRLDIKKFSQSLDSYAAGTAEMKNAVRRGSFRHPNNSALNWQAGHVQSKKVGDYEKPIKNQDHPWKKIDGIQAICMAVDAKRRIEAKKEVPYVGSV